MPRVFVAAVLALNAGAAVAADLPYRPAPPPPPLWTWSGFYFGGHVGGGLGLSTISDPAGPGLYGGDVRTPSALAGLQAGVNWQVDPNWIVGAEAEISALNANGANTCLASSGTFSSANCNIHQSALATLTGRVGYATGPGGLSLLYAKAGAAWLKQQIDVASNPLIFSTSESGSRWGWTVGAGIEQAISPALSMKFEYDYANFGSGPIQTPQSLLLLPSFNYVLTPAGSASLSQSAHTFKVGLNVKLGGDVYARFPESSDYKLRGAMAPSDGIASRGDIEIGGRVWYSSGRFQKDLGATADPAYQNVLNSRLTYQNTAASGELFGRIDGPWNVFLKGHVGGGKLLSGKMNDEDWIPGAGIPYSNTLSDPVTGGIGYATVDAGYNLVQERGYKLGAFVGYNYYRDNKSAYGCTQIAGAPICDPAIGKSTLVITQDDTWQSLRVGLNGVVMLTNQLKLTADAAYLPYVTRTGVDNHLLRTDVPNTLSPESGTGQGVQLEAVLSYMVSRSFSIGAGARYWGMWATSSDAKTNIFSTACPCQTLPARAERYGGFLEASYKFDGL